MNEELLRVQHRITHGRNRESFQHNLNDKEKPGQDQGTGQAAPQDQQQAEIDGLANLRDQVGDDPQHLLDELETLRQEKRTLDREVQTCAARARKMTPTSCTVSVTSFKKEVDAG